MLLKKLNKKKEKRLLRNKMFDGVDSDKAVDFDTVIILHYARQRLLLHQVWLGVWRVQKDYVFYMFKF